MGRSASSKRWLDRQHNDSFTQRAKREGFRSRAAYKLLEIQELDKIIHNNMVVVDLGAAPGGWSQVAKRLLGPGGRVIALDILPIEPIQDVTILQGDFCLDEVYQQLLDELVDKNVNVVLSDMAPNLSGISAVDSARASYLNEIALDFALKVLPESGCFVVKAFHGSGFSEFHASLKKSFKHVATRKPKASRRESKEVFLIAKNPRVLDI